MFARISRLFLILGGSAFLGCTNANPGFGVLNQDNLPQPLFSGKSSEWLSTTNLTSGFAISGTCDYKISSIEAQVVGVNSAPGPLSAVTSGAPTLACQSGGTFSFTLKSLTDLGFTATDGQTYTVQLYGVTTLGLSHASSIQIMYSNPNSNGPKRMVITSGSTESGSASRQAASTSFRAELRADHRTLNYTDPTVSDAMTSMTSSGGHFKAKIGAAASAD